MVNKRKKRVFRREKLRRKKILRKILITFILIGLVFLLTKVFFLGREKSWTWNGKRQINVAVEMADQKVAVFLIVPQNKLVSVVIFPSNLEIETPWFGKYQVGKLPLLAKQEKKKTLFKSSLSYFSGIPIDESLMATNLTLEKIQKHRLSFLFFPPISLEKWHFWRFFQDKEIIWKIINIERIATEEERPDGSIALIVEPSSILEAVQGYVRDPLVRKENLAVSVFNTGQKSGLAQKVANLISTMGGQILEIKTSSEDHSEDCLIELPYSELKKTATIQRISRVLECSVIVNRVLDSESKEVQIFVKNVKI